MWRLNDDVDGVIDAGTLGPAIKSSSEKDDNDDTEGDELRPIEKPRGYYTVLTSN